jgi:Mechanosensitive ion channel
VIAGAGVLGVAIGFGAQSFVRDVMAGMFYLLDDAFRGRRIHPGRQLQGHRRIVQHSFGQVAASPRHIITGRLAKGG